MGRPRNEITPVIKISELKKKKFLYLFISVLGGSWADKWRINDQCGRRQTAQQ